MPVIRGETKVTAITAERREKIKAQLTSELSGEATPGGPVIFEIPFERSETFFDNIDTTGNYDVLVVWDAWKTLTSELRSTIIREVYEMRPDVNVVQALGVTIREAIEEQLLPYRVVPIVHPNQIDPEVLKRALITEGALNLSSNRIELRLPTRSLAEQALRRLAQKHPNGSWSIIPSTDHFPDGIELTPGSD